MTEAWDLAGSEGGAALVFNSTRAAYAVSQAAGDAVASASASLSFDEDDADGGFQQDPTDPKKFFIEEDTTMRDAIQYCLLIAALYAISQTFAAFDALP